MLRSLQLLGHFLVGVILVLLALSPAQAANPFADARAATRKLSSSVVRNTCSAVVIAPNRALTAKHCAEIPGLLVDGLPATVTRAHPVEDIAELNVPGIACPCVQISATRPALDESIVVVGYLYGDVKITARGEYLGDVVTPTGEHYGVVMAMVGPGVSGGGVFRVLITGEIRLLGVVSGMAPLGSPTFYVEVSRDAQLW